MAILVDPAVYKDKGGTPFAHMMSDAEKRDDEIAELNRMADNIGLKREWLQNDPYHPHYDVTRSKRAMAIRHGAKEVTSQEMVLMNRERHERRLARIDESERLHANPQAQTIFEFLKFCGEQCGKQGEEGGYKLAEEPWYDSVYYPYDHEVVEGLVCEWLKRKEERQ